VAVFVGIRIAGDDDQAAPAAAGPAASAPAAPTEQPSAPDPQQPAAVKTPAALSKRPEVTPGGSARLTKLKVTPLVQGTGPKVRKGQTILANYVLAGYADGKVIQATWDQGKPAPLQVGQLIPGFDQGITGVRVGSRVQMDVPSKLAYGDSAANGAPTGDLRFIVDVLAAQ
jgi:peptidylprolyl isomerase